MKEKLSGKRFGEFASLLYLRTEEGAVSWVATANEDEFQTELNHAVVRLWRDSTDYGISLLDADGRVVDSIKEQDLVQSISPRILLELHMLAKRIAEHDLLEESIKELRDKSPA